MLVRVHACASAARTSSSGTGSRAHLSSRDTRWDARSSSRFRVRRFKPGDRAFIAPKVPCGACKYCRDGHFPQCSGVKERLPGGFAEYILVPKLLLDRGAYLLPESISFDQSTFIEPLACVVRSR